MSRNTQEYINGLYYLDLNNSLKRKEHDCSVCQQKVNYLCNNCNNDRQLTGEITNLSEFTNLKGINASNNQITSLDFLSTLPKKEKLKVINLFGNQIKEVDFAELFTTFPNLERINLQNNPLSAKNLSNLSSEQFGKLVNGIKEKKIRIDSFKGTVLMDLLDYAQKLVSQGRPEYQAYVQTLNSINQPNQTNEPPNNKSPLLISGVVILVAISALVIGYLWGKKKQQIPDYE